ncbi:hypothetical protein Csa_015714 [Cucumis sativus]|nr:hypothetical protein Csa_015714 [Cucumis sativus]
MICYRCNSMHSSPQRLGSPHFLGRLYRSFSRESRVLHTSFNTEETRHILARIIFALLSTSICNVASARSREFRTHFLILKEPDAFSSEAACLSYFLRMIMASIES